MVSQELIEILCCPQTKQKLSLGAESLTLKINDLIAQSALKSRNNIVVEEKVDALLVCEDGLWAYPVRDQIPVMLIPEAIPLN